MTNKTINKFNGIGKIIALVPALNEAHSITATVQGLLVAVDAINVVVIDDGSADETAALAKEAGASVISLPKNIGKGNAVNEGFRRLAPADNDILLLIDADLGDTSIEVAKLVEPLSAGTADMVIAVFGKPQKKGGFGLVKGLARWGIKRFGGLEVRAPLSGQRAMRAGLFRDVGGLAAGYGMETGLTIDVLRSGYRVLEVDTNMRHNETGRDLAGFKHRGKQLIAVAKVLFLRVLSKYR